MPTLAKCRPPRLQIQSAMNLGIRLVPWVLCTRRGHGPCPPPSHHNRCHRRQSRSDLQPCFLRWPKRSQRKPTEMPLRLMQTQPPSPPYFKRVQGRSYSWQPEVAQEVLTMALLLLPFMLPGKPDNVLTCDPATPDISWHISCWAGLSSSHKNQPQQQQAAGALWVANGAVMEGCVGGNGNKHVAGTATETFSDNLWRSLSMQWSLLSDDNGENFLGFERIKWLTTHADRITSTSIQCRPWKRQRGLLSVRPHHG